MSAPNTDEITVSDKGMTVRKAVNTDQFETLAIVFDLHSERDSPVTLRLHDTIPDDVSLDDIGFHTDYGSEHWSVSDEQITFDREFMPNEQFTTVYGVRNYTQNELEALLTPPDIEVIELASVTDDRSQSSPVPDQQTSEPQEVIRSEPMNEPTMTQDNPDPEPRTKPQVETEPSTAHSSSSDKKESTDEITVPVTGGVARVLAKELRAGTLSREDKMLLREELGPGENSTDARIRHLQNEVSDLSAYTDALEEFIDTQGTGQEVLEELREEMDTVLSEFESLQKHVEEANFSVLKSSIDSLNDDVQDVQSSLKDIGSRVDDYGDSIHDLENELTRIDSIEDAVDELRDDVEEMTAFREQLSSVFGAMGQAGMNDVEDEETEE